MTESRKLLNIATLATVTLLLASCQTTRTLYIKSEVSDLEIAAPRQHWVKIRTRDGDLHKGFVKDYRNSNLRLGKEYLPVSEIVAIESSKELIYLQDARARPTDNLKQHDWIVVSLNGERQVHGRITSFDSVNILLERHGHPSDTAQSKDITKVRRREASVSKTIGFVVGLVVLTGLVMGIIGYSALNAGH